MTPRDHTVHSRVRSAKRLAMHPITLWAAFVGVHLALGIICLTAPSLPMGDVTITYAPWVRLGVDGGVWMGVTVAWVYPVLAMVPMLASLAFGWTFFASTWVTLAMVIDAVAFAVLLQRGGPARRTAGAAWWWLAFLLAVGPVVIGRIDVFATAVAIVGVLVIVGRPALGAALLTIGAWIKVWPAAIVAAAFIALRARLAIALAASLTTLAVLLVGFALGGGPELFGFITQQSDRGLQIEAPLAAAAMWSAWAGGPNSIYYDRGILTYQLRGDGVAEAAALSTPLLAIAVLGIVAIGVIGAFRRVEPARLLPPLVLALTTALILFNKVGSPQFAGWLAVPILLGLVAARLEGGRSFRLPAMLALAIGALTQVVYPYWYGLLLRLDTGVLAALTVRNALYVVMFAWALVALVSAITREDSPSAAQKVPTTAS